MGASIQCPQPAALALRGNFLRDDFLLWDDTSVNAPGALNQGHLPEGIKFTVTTTRKGGEGRTNLLGRAGMDGVG